ncbi:hypothetical protein ACPROK_06120 [Glutamicibacter soli]|uniref:Uncharacterized protein n=1 Tax=Glutamicibacter soli TaxID=453836 RepID=A0A6L9G0W1_9MICC|nr:MULTISPECIES: hypothetical protein [Glutamicibacter]NAZ14958.1 hypothetical protein [Glutamicibacter soli]QRQ78119.1 hypothetical protein JQN66_14560 [Glutamicibacter protophormiae]
MSNQIPCEDQRLLRIFCDYGAEWPLWECGMQVPEDYGLSDTLCARLSQWNTQFQEHMHWDHGWRMGFDVRRWTQTGHRLAKDVQREVGPSITVRYWQ